jgi:hypothetical protein
MRNPYSDVVKRARQRSIVWRFGMLKDEAEGM